MNEFKFKTDSEGYRFCRRIADEMKKQFNISEQEAFGRINENWKHLIIDQNSILFHEDEEYWAKDLYYGHDSYWWMNPPDLKPLPYFGVK